MRRLKCNKAIQKMAVLSAYLFLLIFIQSCDKDNSSKNASGNQETSCNKKMTGEGWNNVLYEAPDDKSGKVIAFIQEGWLNLQRQLPSGKILWHIVLAKANNVIPPKVTFNARDDGSNYPSYAVITYMDNTYFIKDDGSYIRCRRQLKDKNFSSWLQPPSPVSEYNRLGSAGYGSSDLVAWASKSQLIVGTGGPGGMSDCIINLAYPEPEEKIIWRASATKMGMRSFFYKGEEAFLYDDGELLIAKLGDEMSSQHNKQKIELAVGAPAPKFNFQKILIPNKSELSLQEFEGKVLLLDFWGVWCEPCVQSIPKVQKLYDTYKDKDFIVLGIHSSQNCDKLNEFIQKHNITYPIAIASEEMQKTYGITAWPTYVLIDRQGNVIAASTNISSIIEVQLDKIFCGSVPVKNQ